MKISSVKKAAILATVLSGCIFGNSVDAANIGVVGATDFSSTDVGIIEGSYVTSTINTTPINAVLTGYNGDTSIYNLVDGDKNSIWIRQYTYSQTNLVPNVNVNSQGDWNSEKQSGEIKGAPNAHGVATKNGFVYIADYDSGAIGVGKITDTGIVDLTNSNHINLKEDLMTYAGHNMQHELGYGELYCKGESVLVEGDSLYVLVNIDTYDASGANWSNYFEYSNSYLMKYDINRDGTLSFNSCAEMGKNTDRSRLNKYNDRIFATAIGGYQNFEQPNEETSLNVATIDKNTGWIKNSNAISVPDNVKNLCDWFGNSGTEFRDLKIMPNGTAYVLCYSQGGDGASSSPYIFKTTVSNLLSETPVDWEVLSEGQVAGYFNAIDAEHYTKRVWVQNGNTIQVYLDGAAEPIVFKAGDFASNPYFSGIQSWAVIKPDTLTGNIAKLREDETKVVNDKAIWKDATLTNQIASTTTLNSDAVVTLGNDKIGDVTNNILAVVYAKDGNVTVDANGKTLGLQVENTIGTPVGIYAGYGNSADITADTVNIITKGMKNGNSLNNAIMLDAVVEGEQSTITVNGNVNIAMTGGYGGNGIAVQKTDRLTDETISIYDEEFYSYDNTITLREASYTADEAAIITINGDVSVKGADNQTWGIEANKENVFSRFNNAGILTSVNKSQVNVNGNVDMDVYGNGVTVNAEDSSVTIAKGGQITVPKGTDYGYYTLAAYNGTINMNMGADGKTVGTDDVVLNGDIFALKNGSINLALVTADSELNGIVDNAGEANIYLQNGATWNNVQNNERYALDYEDKGSGAFDKNGNYIGVSHVTNLYGGNSYDNAGVINQSVNSNNLTIDNYSGNTVVVYNHNANKPTEVYGGDVTIKSAEADSAITLRTDSVGIEFANTESVENVLDALANKLYYTGYVTGERNLDGYVEIAEGITSSSVRKAYGHIGYNEKDGQGSFAGNVENLEPDSQTKDSFTAPIFGVEAKDTAYVEDKVLKDGVYEFTKEKTTITVNNNLIAGGLWLPDIGAAVSASGSGNKTEIDLNGNEFVVNATANTHSTGIAAIDKGVVEINNPGDITATATGSGQTAAIFANSGGEVYIHNGDGGTVIARASASYADNGAVIKTMNGASGIESKIIIDGMVDVVADKNEGANEAISAVASRIEIGGGNIEAKNGAWAAIRAYGEFRSTNSGIVNVNVTKDEDGNITGAGNRKTTITGDFVTNGGMGTKGQISVGLRGEDSYWHGKYTDNDGYGVTPGQLGSVNLWIEDGAHWTGYSSGSVNVNINGEGSYWDGYSTNSKMLLSLTDGAIWKNSNASKTSLIGNFVGDGGYIENAGGVTIDNYSGNTTVIYKHDAEVPNNIIGGDVTIKSAAEDSEITLVTDNIGVEANQHNEVLDSLAKKLYYTAYVNGENNLAGYVQIAEGLTASSVTKAVAQGDIEFSAETGQGGLYLEPDSQTKDSFTAPIFGVEAKDTAYVEDKVLKDGVYNFTKEKTTITVNNNLIAGGLWLPNIGAVVSASGSGNKTEIDLNGNELVVNATANTHSTGVAAIDKGVVEINNPGDITATANGSGQTAAIFANSGGEVHIHNGDGGTVIARASASYADNGAVIKTMNGASGIESKIIIDGMVDVVADKNEGANEAISAVASRIEIGGGNIEAKNGAWAAIRAYGEFRSDNSGIVNVNVTKDEDGNITGAGNRKTTITGDFVTNGGMGTKGQISVGLRGEDSYWHGKYTDNDGYGVTPGQLGSVNLWIEDGAHWTGYSSGSVNVNINGEGSYWDGYSTNSKMLLSLTDGAIWKNSNASKTSLIGNFVGDGGYIENAGGVTIDNYSGNTTVIYKHDAEVPTNIIGGDVTIKSAAEDSEITLRTDNAGIDTSDKAKVNNVLDGLAKKLYYTAYINNAQDNLKGYVEIAEGLTTSSVTKAVGDIEFSAETGQGSLLVSDGTEGGESGGTEGGESGGTEGGESGGTEGGESGGTEGGESGGTEGGESGGTEGGESGGTEGGESGGTEGGESGGTEGGESGGTEGGESGGTEGGESGGTEGGESGGTEGGESGGTEGGESGGTEGGESGGTEGGESGGTEGGESGGTEGGESGGTEGGESGGTEGGESGGTEGGESGGTEGGESGVTKGDYETAMMSGAKSAMVSSAMMLRAEANDIMKRMGDLRMAEGEEGVWAKYSASKQEMDAQNAKFINSYKAYQLGYDKKVGDWTVGVAASYGDGESTYSNGRGENSVVSLGLYGAWNGKDGQYVDLIMKRSKLDNEYTLNGNVFIGQIEADYDTWGTSISAEYGKRFETSKGFYLEPNAELTLGRVEGVNYNTSLSAGGERLNVQQDDYDTLVGRLGLRLGQKLDKASYYAKLAVAKEFAGDFDTKYATLDNSGRVSDTKETYMNFKDTWYELQIGGTAQLSDNSYIYASYERNFGADVEQKWRVDAGLRFSF